MKINKNNKNNKEVKKGTIKKTRSKMLLLGGTRVFLKDENTGKFRKYVLGSDIAIILKNDARLFPVR
jgi:hypothetical protein